MRSWQRVALCVVLFAEQLGQILFQNLLKDQTLKGASYQVNSAVHRAKLRHWQALAVLSAFIPHSDTHQLLAQIWPFLQVSMRVTTDCIPSAAVPQSNLDCNIINFS